MGKEITTGAASRQLIELSLTRPPVHSFNRQLVRIVIDTVGATAATLWLLRENELVLCEEIEDAVGAVRSIRVPQEAQQRALRTAFEKGEVVILKDAPATFDPLGPPPEAQRNLVFIPVAGLRGNLGVLRLILPPSSEPMLSRQVQLAETLSGYYSLYSAQRILTVQHEERRDIDNLSKAILQLQHYTFSRQLPEVVVNSGVEVARIDRVVLLTTRNGGELSVRAVSSVAEADRKGAWSRLVCELGELVLQLGQPVQYLEGVNKPEDIEDEELRELINSYLLMTQATSVLIYPLSSGEEKVGVLLFENFGRESALTVFERVLCTVYASHAASALSNYRRFMSVPLSRFYAKRVDREAEGARRGRPWVGKALKWAALALLLIGVFWLLVLYPVNEKVGAACFVVPETERIVTAKTPGKIERVLFDLGDDVEESQLLIQFETEQIELELNRERENARALEMQIVQARAAAADEADPKARARLADVAVLEHQLAAKRHLIRRLESRLEDCFLRAPISGTVIAPEEPEKMAGVYVMRAGESLCRIGSIGRQVKVRIAVPDDRIADIAEGMEVEIRLRPLIAQEPLRGHIAEVAERSVTYKNANVFMADVIVQNSVAQSPEGEPQYLLKPGMTGKAKIIRPGKTNYASVYGKLLYRKLKYWLF